MEEKLPVHKFHWTDDSIKRFWNTMYQYPNAIGIAGVHGKIMVRQIKKKIPLENKNILDFGVGHGYLLNEVLNQTKKARTAGYDYSATAVNHTKERFKSEKRFIKAYSPDDYSDAKGLYDVVIMTEVLEHITDENMQETFNIINVFLREKGFLVITVPNKEDVEAKHVFCPECGCLFHPVQHQKGYTLESLQILLNQYGFIPLSVKPVSFGEKIDLKSFFKEVYLCLKPDKKSNILGIFIKQTNNI